MVPPPLLADFAREITLYYPAEGHTLGYCSARQGADRIACTPSRLRTRYVVLSRLTKVKGNQLQLGALPGEAGAVVDEEDCAVAPVVVASVVQRRPFFFTWFEPPRDGDNKRATVVSEHEIGRQKDGTRTRCQQDFKAIVVPRPAFATKTGFTASARSRSERISQG